MLKGSPYIIVRETSGGENGDLLSSGDAVHGVNGRDTSLDHFFRVDTGPRVDGLTWREGRRE